MFVKGRTIIFNYMQSCMQKNEKNMKNGTVEAKLAWVLDTQKVIYEKEIWNYYLNRLIKYIILAI